MTQRHRTLLLLGVWCASLSTASAESGLDERQLPVPLELQGLWAKGRHCSDRERQLHVSKHTMQFGTKPPVRSYYAPPNPESEGTDYYGGIIPDVLDPSFMSPDTALTYDSDLGFLFSYGEASSPEQIYYRLSLPGTAITQAIISLRLSPSR